MKVKTIQLSDELFTWLEEYRWKHKISSVNEAIRQILKEKKSNDVTAD